MFAHLLAALLLAPPVALPKPDMEGGKPVLAALKARQTSREFSPRPLAPQVLSNLLWAAYGVNRPATGGRTAPSAHNWQVIDIYVTLPAGIFLYNAAQHRLEPVSDTDARLIAGTQEFTATAPLNLVYVARMEKMKASAEDTETDLLVWAAVEAGSISQNVALYCASEGLGNVVRVGVQREAFAKAAQLAATHKIVLAQTVGYPR
jgi:SagB-type dehydrogenase family enzyme